MKYRNPGLSLVSKNFDPWLLIVLHELAYTFNQILSRELCFLTGKKLGYLIHKS